MMRQWLTGMAWMGGEDGFRLVAEVRLSEGSARREVRLRTDSGGVSGGGRRWQFTEGLRGVRGRRREQVRLGFTMIIRERCFSDDSSGVDLSLWCSSGGQWGGVGGGKR